MRDEPFRQALAARTRRKTLDERVEVVVRERERKGHELLAAIEKLAHQAPVGLLEPRVRLFEVEIHAVRCMTTTERFAVFRFRSYLGKAVSDTSARLTSVNPSLSKSSTVPV